MLVDTYLQLLKQTDKSQDHCVPESDWFLLFHFSFWLVGWLGCGKEKSDPLKSDETELRDAASVADQRKLDPCAGPAALLYAGREIAPSAIKIVARMGFCGAIKKVINKSGRPVEKRSGATGAA
ncbi:hypothetical protein T07_13491 [Trichinella nelsoni]|uniref:Uncharacterized protein n=1 Tax=Trichinella nelsoni TaxID=6336 RepID=A0A0V0RNZ2_9BILA|nr:hypothetical protein T07_13491 [Trichinella nelsoni]